MNETDVSVDKVTLQWWIDHAMSLESKNKVLEQRIYNLEETLSVLREELHRIIEDKHSVNS